MFFVFAVDVGRQRREVSSSALVTRRTRTLTHNCSLSLTPALEVSGEALSPGNGRGSCSRPKRSGNDHRTRCKPQLQRLGLFGLASAHRHTRVRLFLATFCQLNTAKQLFCGLAGAGDAHTTQLQHAAPPPRCADAAQSSTQLGSSSLVAATSRESENTSNVGTTTGPRPDGEAQ